MSQEKIQALTQTQQPMRKSLLDRLRDEVLEERPSPLAILNDKSTDLMEMERIVKSVYEVLLEANPYLKKHSTPDEIKDRIERHAVLFLKNYGLPVCRCVSEPIVSLKRVPFNSYSTFLHFNDLCKIEKTRYDEYVKILEGATKKVIPKKNYEPLSLEQIFRENYGQELCQIMEKQAS